MLDKHMGQDGPPYVRFNGREVYGGGSGLGREL